MGAVSYLGDDLVLCQGLKMILFWWKRAEVILNLPPRKKIRLSI